MDKKMVPEVRFKGFSDDWEQHSFQNTLIIHSGKDYKHLNKGNIPVYGTGGYMLSVDEKLSKVDGIGLGRKGTIDKPQYLKAPFWTVDTLFYMTPKPNFEILFLYAIVQKYNWKKLNEASGVPSLSKKTIEKVIQFYPVQLEQKKLGILLKTITEAVLLQQDKISLYVQLKEKILCGIFPSNGYSESQIQFTKFHDEWKERKLEDVCTTYSGGTPKVNNNDFYNGHIPFIRSAEINKCKTELFITKLGLDNSSAKLVKKGDILYALYGATSGTVGISKINGAINQAILAIHPQKEYDSEYIAQWLKINKQKIVRTYLQGGQGNLSASIIKKISIPFPSKEQQVAIGKLLSNLDRNISEYKERMNELISLKKFLLQRLFI